MNPLIQPAVAAIAAYKTNKIIMDFVNNEAMEQTAADIRAKTKSGTTAKAVAILIIKNKLVRNRFNEYVNAGLIGVYIASFNN